MRGLSIIQPWASLIAHGLKRYETRGYSVSYRGVLIIHASQKVSPEIRERCQHNLFQAAFERLGIKHLDDLPRGAVVGLAALEGDLPTEQIAEMLALTGNQRELAFGNYQPGRRAWQMGSPRVLTPIKASGSLGLWTPAPRLVSAIEEQIREAISGRS